ncbi:MAG: ABC transporter permease [Deltaproteobacteria bacterium]|jgi:putative ABC transport system permease protein|nr:ABC transporter permease [Deltaproteobacteria bacterium]MBT6432283.1 ABC transporter permease [Deltaproteobacteria bacterium]
MTMYFIIAWRNLVQARRRTLLLSFALAAVSLLLVTNLALSRGVSDTMLRSATMLVAGHINVAGFYKAKPQDAYPVVTVRDELRAAVTEIIGDRGYVLDRGRGWGKIVSDTTTIQAAMGSITIAEEPLLRDKLQLAPQSDYKPEGQVKILGSVDGLSDDDTIMIFAGQAKKLEVDVGDSLTITTETLQGKVNTRDVTVAAIAKDVGILSMWNIFVPKQVLKDLYGYNDNTTGAVQVYLNEPRDADDIRVELSDKLLEAGFDLMEYMPAPFWQKFEIVSGEDWTGQRLDLTTWRDEITFMTWAVTAIDSISITLIGILLVIIIVGIINTMFISVRERTREIGSLRAIGMRRRRVLIMVMTEAFLLGLFASTAGSLLGAGIANTLDTVGVPIPEGAMRSVLMSDTLHLVVESSQITSAVLTFTIITMLAALFPATRAARMQPVTAIQHTS